MGIYFKLEFCEFHNFWTIKLKFALCFCKKNFVNYLQKFVNLFLKIITSQYVKYSKISFRF
jgi:hypothetical protein